MKPLRDVLLILIFVPLYLACAIVTFILLAVDTLTAWIVVVLVLLVVPVAAQDRPSSWNTNPTQAGDRQPSSM